MTRRWRRAALYAGAVVFCLVAFYVAITRRFEFWAAGIVRAALHALPPAGQDAMHVVFSHLPIDEEPAAWIVRKAASVLFFAAIGVIARVAASRRLSTPASGAWITVGAAVAMSAAIEAYEWPEPFGDIAFDLGCGAVGGLLAVLGLRVARRL